jgi:hypothetical protein
MIQRTSKFSVFSGPGPSLDTSTIKKADGILQNALNNVPSSFGKVYDLCQSQYDFVFESISCDAACKASLQDRDEMKARRDFTLTYGELSSIEPMWKLLNKIHNEGLLPTTDSNYRGKFYDLGSGSGRPVIAATLIMTHLQRAEPRNAQIRIKAFTGVELLPGLYNLSQTARKIFSSLDLNCEDNWKKLCDSRVVERESSSVSSPQTDFILGSIFNLNECSWTDGDVVFVNSTCFDVSMLLRVYGLAQSMRPGSIIITLSRSMVEIGSIFRNINAANITDLQQKDSTQDIEMWSLISETREIMSW